MWKEEIEKYIREINNKLISENEFLTIVQQICRIEDCPVSKVLYTIDRIEPYGIMYIGDQSLISQHNSKNRIFTEQVKVDTIKEITMCLEFKEDEFLCNNKYFEDLFYSYWKPYAQRDINTLLMPIKQVNIKSLLYRTIEENNLNKDCAFVFCDIDKFGDLNAKFTQSGGDYAMRHLSIILEKYTKDSILIHRSGDEFIIVHFSNKQHEILEILYSIRRDVNTLSFPYQELGDVTFTISSGIKFIEKGKFNKEIDFDDYASFAENALKPDGKDSKKRNEISIYKEHEDIVKDEVNIHNLKVSFLSSKVNMLRSDSYRNIWLNYISNDISKRNIEKDKLNEIFNNYIEEVKPTFSNENTTCILDNIKVEYGKIFSIYDIMIAIIQGLYRNSKFEIDKKIKLYFESNIYKLSINNEPIINFEYKSEIFNNKSPLEISFEIPVLPQLIGIKDTSSFLLSTSLLVVIGDFKNKKLESLFNEKVIVDIRPTTGGGLPDFWEASLSKVLTYLHTNRNLNNIFIVSQIENTYTDTYLKQLNNGKLSENIDYIAYKTGLSTKIISEVEKRIQNKVYNILEDEIIDKLFELEFSNSGNIDIKRFNHNSPVKNRKGYLESKINSVNYKLNELDGCMGETLSKVYPIVIYTMKEANIYSQSKSQDFKHYKELIDFKVRLTNPSQDKLPWFYEKEEEKFKKYFKESFLETDGVFYTSINEDNQEEIILQYLAKLFNSKLELVSSRRAIIILKNRIKGNEPDPLGLTSIRIYLTKELNITKINFTFIWRTVEAIVGFPYSAYGSISYAEEFLSKLKLLLPQGVKVHLGDLTYIAQTLHIFQDTYSENIAKNIIDEATYY
ncbi:GGDEF domain-containing protein [Aliarcobacter cryaerophilus]|uniref:GGDEF domain-containing protein n=1 Tax=Aliarcobacter cryaerophilus TaxID=28198 RepID=UPI0021B573DF|nr:GGDEF domain-containing protein [Aliarcobacter cryaerophilus]MCT7530946.1 GGDEF domain-containing protein [Aliarcobacter cryaerophilus]